MESMDSMDGFHGNTKHIIFINFVIYFFDNLGVVLGSFWDGLGIVLG